MAILGKGLLTNSNLCNSTVICEQSPGFCDESGKKKGPIFECDFLSPVGEALNRVVGIIDAVQTFEVNKIRPQAPQNCLMDNNLLIPEMQKKWWKKFKKPTKGVFEMERAVKEYIQDRNQGEKYCFIIEYAIQVRTDAKLVNGQGITESLDEATDLLLE